MGALHLGSIASLGLGALFFDVGLDVLTATGGGRSVQFSRGKSFTTPSGSVGFYGKWAVGDRWYIGADLRAIKVNVSSVNATIYEGGLGYRFLFTPRFGAEAGYGISSYNLDITSTRASGKDVLTTLAPACVHGHLHKRLHLPATPK